MGALSLGWDTASDHPLDLVILDALPGVGPRTVLRLCRTFGGARGALAAPRDVFTRVAGRKAAEARGQPDVRRAAREALDRARRMGMKVLTWGAAEYPDAFAPLADPPPVIYLRGDIGLLDARPALTVVGSRRVTVRGREVARSIAGGVVERGGCVVSGMALGTDAAAHEGALEAGGRTVAVLGTGADVPYPSTHRGLYRRIVQEGLVVSEFAPGTRAAPWHFPRRNRLLAALGSAGVVVVEAGARSGSLITVDHALDLGREVWAVPGPIDGPACHGSNALLADGARPVLSTEHLLGALGLGREATAAPPVRDGAARSSVAPEAARPPVAPASDHAPVAPEVDRSPVAPASDRDTGTDRLLAAFGGGSATAEELAARSGLSAADVLGLLTTLELRGTVTRLPGARFRTAA